MKKLSWFVVVVCWLFTVAMVVAPVEVIYKHLYWLLAILVVQVFTTILVIVLRLFWAQPRTDGFPYQTESELMLEALQAESFGDLLPDVLPD